MESHMFLEDVPMKFQIIEGEQLVWLRRYKGIDYIYNHISLSAVYILGKKEMPKYNKLFKKEMNSNSDITGAVFL